jgi:hypothetical protein
MFLPLVLIFQWRYFDGIGPEKRPARSKPRKKIVVKKPSELCGLGASAVK